MNPGYLSFIVIIISIILLTSGWKEIILREVSHQVLFLFFIVFFITVPFQLTWKANVISLSFVVIALFTLLIWSAIIGWFQKIHLLVLAGLITVFHYLLLEIYQLNTFYSLISPNVDISIWLSILVVLINRVTWQQIALISTSLIVGETYFQFIHAEPGSMYLGNAVFWDKWWLSVLLIRLTTVFFSLVLRVILRAWQIR